MTYSELKAAVSDWMHRNDLAANVDLFIDLFESRASNNLRSYEMENRAISTPTSEYLALPLDFAAVKSFKVGDTVLQYAAENHMIGGSGTRPVYYTITGGEVLITPSADGSEVEMVYFQSIPALSDSNTTNWLLSKYPSYYLSGCLLEAMKWAKDPDVGMQDQLVTQAENGINSKGKAAKYGSAPLVVIAS